MLQSQTWTCYPTTGQALAKVLEKLRNGMLAARCIGLMPGWLSAWTCGEANTWSRACGWHAAADGKIEETDSRLLIMRMMMLIAVADGQRLAGVSGRRVFLPCPVG